MSRLYSSPEEVIALKLLALDCGVHSRTARIGAHHAHRFAIQFNSKQISPTVAINKDAFPNSPPDPEGWIKSIHLPAQAQVSRVSFWTQISGFRSLCGRKQRSSFSHRAQLTCVLEPFTRGGLSL
jgi:hypothetical protein